MKAMKKLLASLFALILVLTMMPSTAYSSQAPSKSVTVSTQSGLEAALKNTKVTSITIKTSKTKTFTIGSGSYTQKTITISAPKATISNSGKFKNISIKDAKKFTEKAKNNTIKISDSKLTLVVTSIASVKSMTLSKKSGNLSLTNNGKISTLSVTYKSTLTMKGSSSKVTKVTLGSKAAGSTITSSIGIALTAKSNAKVNLLSGAESSKITLAKDVEVKLANKSKKSITVTAADGSKQTIKSGETSIVNGTAASDDSDSDNKDEENKDDENKEDENKDDSDSGSGGGGGSWDGGGSGSNSTAINFANAIAKAEVGSTVTLANDVSGNVNATWNGTGTLTIDFGNHKVNGSVSITAPNATRIYLIDTGVNSYGATISGNLTIDAPLAHVENSVKVSGTVRINNVADSTFVLQDSAKTVEVYGQGKISFDDELTIVPPVSIKTTKQVILDGNIEKVSVDTAGAQIDVSSGTTIDNVEVNSGTTTNPASISGEGTIANLSVSAPVSVDTTVNQITVSKDNAEISVEAGTNVGTIVVDSTVSQISLKGTGTVTSLDLSQVSDVTNLSVTVDENTTTPVIVATADQVESIKAKLPELADNVVFVTKVELSYNGEKILPVGTAIDYTQASIKVTYSDGTTKDLSVSAEMFDTYIRTEKGTSNLYVTYGGIKSDHNAEITITYKAIDTVSLTCTSGSHYTTVNGSGYPVERYSVNGTVFADLRSYLTATSTKGLEISYSYCPLHGEEIFENGLPAEPGDYVILAETADTEDCYGSSCTIFICAVEDALSINVNNAASYKDQGITVSLAGTDESGLRAIDIAFTTINEGSTNFAELEEVIEAVITSRENYELEYSYFAQGARGEGHDYSGLPEIDGSWVINVWTYGATYDNGEAITIYVESDAAKEHTVQAKFSGDGVPYSEQTINAYEGISIEAGTTYNITFLCDTTQITEYYVYKINMVQGEIKDLSDITSEVKSNGYPKEEGYYWIWVCAPSAGDIQETWVLFKVYIEEMDSLTVDTSGINTYTGVSWSTEEASDYDCNGILTFGENADFSELKNILESIVSSSMGMDLKYSYYACGMQDGEKYYHEGILPSIAGKWYIDIYTDGANFNNGRYLSIFVDCENAQPQNIMATFTGSAVSGSSITVSSNDDYEDIILTSTDFEYDFICDGQKLTDVYIYDSNGNEVVLNDGHFTESGTYCFWVCAPGTSSAPETWVYFDILIE